MSRTGFRQFFCAKTLTKKIYPHVHNVKGFGPLTSNLRKRLFKIIFFKHKIIFALKGYLLLIIKLTLYRTMIKTLLIYKHVNIGVA